MIFELDSEYPISSAPSITLEVVKGLSPCALDELHEVAMNTAMSNIGNSSIHSIVESAKDWLRDNNFAGQDGSVYSDMVRKVMQLEMREKKQNGKQLSEAITDFEMIKSAGTINSSPTVAGLKQLISIASRGSLSRIHLEKEGAGCYIVETLRRSGADNFLVAKYGLQALFYFTIEADNLRSMYELGAVAVVLDLLLTYNAPAQFDDTVVSNGLVAMGNLLYDCEVRRLYGRRAAMIAVRVLRKALCKSNGDHHQPLVRDALTLLGSAARHHMSAQQAKFLCHNIEGQEEEGCVICMEAPANLLFVPCGHICVCERCMRNSQRRRAAKSCFMCRSEIVTVVEIEVSSS
eukprot:gene25168-33691_t